MSVEADEIWAILKGISETNKELSKAHQEFKEEQKALQVAQQKTDEQMTRTDEQILSLLESQKETDRKLEKVSDLLGSIGKNQGDVAEEFFFNSLVDDPHLGGIHFDDISKNESKQRGKLQEEYDIVMTNGNAIGIVEVKYKAHENDLGKLEHKMRNFKTLFPVYQNYKLYGAIASFHINDDAKKEALERGFFVLQRKGEVVQTDCGEHLMVL